MIGSNQQCGFEVVEEFEKKIAEFFGAPFAVAVDGCTHGLELCLRLMKAEELSVPRNTYLSVPMLASKLGIQLRWKPKDYRWSGHYCIASCYDHEVDNWYDIIDAAVLWQRKSYIPYTMMCVSMQYQKHLSVGRLGVILLDDEKKALQLKKMSYDGRLPGIPWRDQNVDTMGYHYYAQIELAALALEKLPKAIETEPRKWTAKDWPCLTDMDVFKNTLNG